MASTEHEHEQNMKLALELESLFNEIFDQKGMTDVNQRERTQRYLASRCVMGDALSGATSHKPQATSHKPMSQRFKCSKV
jgi:hypothetical protein